MTKKVIISGGTGYVGVALSEELAAAGYQVFILSRSDHEDTDQIKYLKWDAKTPDSSWVSEIEHAHAVINLAGRSIACVFTETNKEQIVNSRVNATTLLADVVANAEHPPKVFVQASATGFYGDTGSYLNTEIDPAGETFKARTCVAWENSLLSRKISQSRQVILRFGPIIGKNSEFSDALANITKAFLGGAAGSGKQYVSWVHRRDITGIILHALADPTVAGIYNAVAPGPVSNAQLMTCIRQVIGRPWIPPAPSFAIKLIAPVILQKDASLILQGQRCSAEKIIETGYQFKYPALKPAFEELYG